MDALAAAESEGEYTTLDASGLAVGIPAGIMGNSEVGHFTIGTGRVVYQVRRKTITHTPFLVLNSISSTSFLQHFLGHLSRENTMLHKQEKTCNSSYIQPSFHSHN